MSASLIASLDAALAAAGEDAVLRRVVGTGSNVVNVDCDVRIAFREYQGEEIVGGINVGDAEVILSPTPILQAQWPGGAADLTTYPRSPWAPKQGDRIVRKATGRTHTVKLPPKLRAPTGEIVRIELTVSG